MIDVAESTVASWLPAQRWFGHKDRAIRGIRLSEPEVLRDDWPLLARLVAHVDLDGAAVDYDLFVGARPTGDVADFLHTHDEAVLGPVSTKLGDGFAYDATLDAVLGLALLERVVPGATARHVRPLGAEQSNTSLVFDDRIVVKLFRQLGDGPNPDVEVTSRLAQLGFAHVAAPVGVWEESGRHLAVAQPYLVGGTDGWSLALTSLRDLFALNDTQQMPVIDLSAERPADVRPADAGGDFAAEAERLGTITAELHAALADAFGRQPADVAAWTQQILAQFERTPGHPGVDRDRVRASLDRLATVADAGPAIRTHGDYHLGQVLRTDAGWYVLDFEGEPARPLAERTAPSAPLRDVAGMLRSLQYAAQVARRERGEDLDGGRDQSAARWEARNRQAFLDGYLPAAEEAGLLPAAASDWSTVLSVFELDKAVYELAYEMSHRPDWVAIPVAAISRLLEG